MKLYFPLFAVFFSASSLLAGSLVQFRTSAGTIDVELFSTDKPVTVRNFLGYVERGDYDGMFLHRCIPGFIVQGGGFATTNSASTNVFTRYLSVPNAGTITNEYLVGPRISNLYGTIAMAKLGGNPNSASSQWFFNLANNSTNLDNQNGGFTVFGRVVGGTNALNFFNTLSRSNGIVDLQWWYGSSASLFSDLPVTYLGAVPPRYNDLFYVDIVPLKISIQPQTNGTKTISWLSINGRTNRVEYSTSLSSSWQLLQSTNGNGSLIQVRDTNTVSGQRLYRVRILY